MDEFKLNDLYVNDAPYLGIIYFFKFGPLVFWRRFESEKAISKARIVNSLDLIASEQESLFKGWFGNLSRQRNGRQRRDIFPQNYQSLQKFLTEDECQCKATEVKQAYKKIMNARGNAWENFQV